MAEKPIVDLPLFKDVRFFFTCVMMFAVLFVLRSRRRRCCRSLCREISGYDATKAGLVLMPGGFFHHGHDAGGGDTGA